MPAPTEAPPQTATPAPATAAVDPYRAYNFKLEVQGVTQGHFTECGGMSISVHPIRYREGGTNQVVRALPGPVEY
jgi:phage tail-like protein